MNLKNVKVAVLCKANLFGLNGLSAYLRKFAGNVNSFKDCGIDIELCVKGADIPLSHLEEESRKQKEYTQSKLFVVKKKFREVLQKTYWGSCFSLWYTTLNNGRRFVRQFKCKIEGSDIIFANDIFSAYYAHAMFPRKPLIFIMHNNGDLYKMLYMDSPRLQEGRMGKKLERIKNEVFQSADRIVFVSETAKNYFQDQYPLYKNKLAYIPTGIEDLPYCPHEPSNPVQLIAVGSLQKRKNQIALIRMVERLCNRYNLELTLVGDGDMFADWQQYVESHALSNVHLVGSLAPSEIHARLSRSDIFVFSSYDEGVPIAGIEALRAGLPIIISDVGGCRELIQNNGFLFNPYNENEFAYCIEGMLNNVTWIQSAGMKSRMLFELRYEISNMIINYSDLFRLVAI